MSDATTIQTPSIKIDESGDKLRHVHRAEGYWRPKLEHSLLISGSPGSKRSRLAVKFLPSLIIFLPLPCLISGAFGLLKGQDVCSGQGRWVDEKRGRGKMIVDGLNCIRVVTKTEKTLWSYYGQLTLYDLDTSLVSDKMFKYGENLWSHGGCIPELNSVNSWLTSTIMIKYQNPNPSAQSQKTIRREKSTKSDFFAP